MSKVMAEVPTGADGLEGSIQNLFSSASQANPIHLALVLFPSYKFLVDGSCIL